MEKRNEVDDDQDEDAVSADNHMEDSDAMESNSTTASDQQSIGGSNHVTVPVVGSAPGVKMAKSVLFDSRSTAHSHCKKVQSVTDCWRWMVRGSSLIKVRPNGRTYNRFFSLEEDLTAIRWVPTTKKASKALVMISSIREVRCVHTSEVLSHSGGSGSSSSGGSASGSGSAGGSVGGSGLAGSTGIGSVGGSSSSLDCTFSIIHGEDFSSLDLIAPTAEEANIWVTGLNALLGTRSGNALGETSALRERWLREEFERAACEGDGSANRGQSPVILDQTAAMALLKEINADLATGRIRQKMAEFDSMKSAEERGRISSRDFVTMFQEIATRPEIHFLLIRFANKDYFTADDFRHFLECEQGMTNVTLDRCVSLIQQFEPSTEARSRNHLILDGMTRFLLSDEGDIFDPNQLHVHQDMSAPLAHYFISTSHNTYLLEDQLRGPSSVEGYVRALQSGCRCVKIDVWDGAENGEPVVCHGNTLTTKIPLADVVRIISEFAFEASKYPLFIHLENHCSVRQQKTVARLLREILGDSLYIPDSGSPDRPPISLLSTSPEQLVGKIVIAGKKLVRDSSVESEGDVTDEDEGAETNRRRGQSRKLKLSRELSQLIALHRNGSSKWPLVRDKNSEPSQGIFSINESTAYRLLNSGPASWAEAAQRCLVRVFPNGSRVDSSNFSPLDFWNSGVQMVALNFQTPGLMMDLYDGKFRQNGGCGYVLKPAMMRQPGFNAPLSPKDTLPATPPQLLRIRVISGQQLPRPRGSAAKATVVDPYVLIQIYGIPVDCAEKKTRTVLDEGDCPVFEESLEFYIHHPEMALVRFIVLDDEFIGDDFIGQYTIPFQCMKAGYRHIRLLSNLGEALDNATLFVHVAFSEKWAGEQLLHKTRSKPVKKQTAIRMTGLKQVDENLKATIVTLLEATRARQNVSQALFELRAECGLAVTANIKQCLRVLLLRLASCSDVTGCCLTPDNVFPVLRIETSSGGNLPAALHRTVVAFEKSILECHFLCDKSSAILCELDERLNTLNQLHDQLDEMVLQACFKGKQVHRVYDLYGWNVALITNQLQLLRQCRQDCALVLEQVRTSDVNLATYYRPNVERPSVQLILAAEDGSAGSLPNSPAHSNGSASSSSHLQLSAGNALSRCTTYPTPLQRSSDGTGEPKLKSILKKSSSSADLSATSDGRSEYYVPKEPVELAEDEE